MHLKQWKETIGHLCLDKIRSHHITGHLQKLKTKGRANRTCNLSMVVLRNVLKCARMDGFIKTLPVDGITWMRCDKKAARLYTREDIERLCEAAFKSKTNGKGEAVPVTKNAQQFADYIRLLAACGAREQEAIKLRWADVDFERRLLTVGAEGDSKNREARRVDFNPALEAHLRNMFERRAPDSQ